MPLNGSAPPPPGQVDDRNPGAGGAAIMPGSTPAPQAPGGPMGGATGAGASAPPQPNGNTPQPQSGAPAMAPGAAAGAAPQGPQPPAQTPMPPKSPFMGAPRYQRQAQGAQNNMRPPSPNQVPPQAPPTAARQSAQAGGGAGAGAQPNRQQAFASGGIVTKPTRAILGENGPEVVVPLTPRSSNKITPSMVGLNPHMLKPNRAPYRSPRGVQALHSFR